MSELVEVINHLSDDKAPGCDGILAEIWKYGGTELISRLHGLIVRVCTEKEVPQEWKDTNIVAIFKKGDGTECGNYRRNSLLSIAGKAFARILLDRLTGHPFHLF